MWNKRPNTQSGAFIIPNLIKKKHVTNSGSITYSDGTVPCMRHSQACTG